VSGCAMSVNRQRSYPLGAAITLQELSGDPHAALARLRATEPVSWVSCLGGWLVTRYDLAVAVMLDAATFTVNDPRFSTAQVVGPSMLSLDGPEHARHRAPFVGPFRAVELAGGLAETVRRRVAELIDSLEPLGQAELRRQFAGPLSAAVIAHALGLGAQGVDDLLRQYEAIVTSVGSITAGRGPTREGTDAFAALRRRLEPVIEAPWGGSLLGAAAAHAQGEGGLSHDEVAADAAVLLFGGIETTEGMIANALLELLRRPEQRSRLRQNPAGLDSAIDESLRLEPAAAVIDRYATGARMLGSAQIRPGELVRVSITAANRDPAVFAEPDSFDPERPNLRRHLAFAQGPHVCVGVHLARLEARLAVGELLKRLPGVRLDPASSAEVSGLVFRKPQRLDVLWDR
jgi:cytochrome P450